MIVFTTLDGLVKSLPIDIPTIQIVALRFAFGIPIILVAMRQTGAPWPGLASWKANAPRGVLSLAAALLFFTALRHLPFAEALALSYLAPLLLAVLAALMLGEKLRLGTIGPILLGLAGVAVISHDNLTRQGAVSTDLIGIAAAFGSAAAYAIGNTLLRSQAQRDHATSIVLVQHVIPAVLALPFAFTTWQPPNLQAWLTFPVLAALGVTGHSLLVWSYARAQAGVLAVVDYLALPYGALLGFVFFAEIPTVALWSGAGLIVIASVIVTRLRA